MQRISVIGSSGSGKTWMARRIADQLGLPRLELDSVFHRPGWVQMPDEEFRAVVGEFVRGHRWVVDGNYTSHGVAEMVWPLADTIVWMDPPRRTVMRRVVARTLRRVITRQELWNGNREPWTNLLSVRPEKSIVVWAWTRFRRTRQKYEGMLADGTWAHLDVHRLRSRRQAAAFMAALDSSA